jgi:O-antigen/teichoic acid export membrane protein
MSGHSRVVMVNTLVFGLGLIGSAAILIPIWGIKGAAVAAALSSVFLNVLRVWEVWSFQRIHPFTRGLFKPLLAGGLAASIVFIAHRQLEPSYLVGFALAVVILYVALLAILGIEQDDKAALMALYQRVRG